MTERVRAWFKELLMELGERSFPHGKTGYIIGSNPIKKSIPPQWRKIRHSHRAQQKAAVGSVGKGYVLGVFHAIEGANVIPQLKNCKNSLLKIQFLDEKNFILPINRLKS